MSLCICAHVRSVGRVGAVGSWGGVYLPGCVCMHVCACMQRPVVNIGYL